MHGNDSLVIILLPNSLAGFGIPTVERHRLVVAGLASLMTDDRFEVIAKCAHFGFVAVFGEVEFVTIFDFRLVLSSSVKGTLKMDDKIVWRFCDSGFPRGVAVMLAFFACILEFFVRVVFEQPSQLWLNPFNWGRALTV